jgi:hypothetical protein
MKDDDFLKLWKEEDGISYSNYPQKIFLDLNNMKRIIDIRHRFCQGEHLFFCYDFRNVTGMNKEARDYSDIYGNEYFHACAVLVNTRAQLYMFNIYALLKKPKTPFKAFIKKEDAVTWLKGMQLSILAEVVMK